jgi:hypothetical protein
MLSWALAFFVFALIAGVLGRRDLAHRGPQAAGGLRDHVAGLGLTQPVCGPA